MNGILTNAEVWYGLSAKQVGQLESVDKLLLRKLLNTPVSTPSEGMQLELGILSINTVIKARRINFLHYLLNTSENEMLSKVFRSQLDQPVQFDWSEQVKADIIDFKIGLSLADIKQTSKNAFKKLVKTKALVYEYNRLMLAKQKHSKIDNLSYTKLDMQNYFKLENINAEEARTLFMYRTRMAKYGENFRGQTGPVSCPLCGLHLDSQVMAYNNCLVIKQNISLEGNYSDIFKNIISNNLVKSLVNIESLRDEKLLQNEK